MTKTLSIVWLVVLAHALVLGFVGKKQKQVATNINTYLVSYSTVK